MTPSASLPRAAPAHAGADDRRLSARATWLAAPLLALCFAATYDGVLWATMHHRLVGAAQALAHAVAALDHPAEADLPALLAQAAHLAGPSDVAGRGGLALAELRDGQVLWQARVGPAAPPGPDAARGAGAAEGRWVAVRLTAPPDPWIAGVPLLRAWFGDIAQVTATAPRHAPADEAAP